MTITICYEPITPSRRSHTCEIATALRTLKETPASPEGIPGSFLIPAKHKSALRAAADDTNVEIKTRAEGSNLRVMLKVVEPELALS